MSQDGAFDGSEAGTGLTTLFEGDWATVRRLQKAKLVVVGGADQGKEIEIAKPRVTGGRRLLSRPVVRDEAGRGAPPVGSGRDHGHRLRGLHSGNGPVPWGPPRPRAVPPP